MLGSRFCESDAQPFLSRQTLLLLEIFIVLFYHQLGYDDDGVRVVNNYQISQHSRLSSRDDHKLVVSDYENVHRMSAEEK